MFTDACLHKCWCKTDKNLKALKHKFKNVRIFKAVNNPDKVCSTL